MCGVLIRERGWNRSDRLQHRLAARQIANARAFFGLEHADRAVFDQHRIAFRAGIQPGRGGFEGHADSLGERAVGIAEHRDTRCDGAGFGAPGIHHERIVDADTDQRVDILGGEVILGADEAGHMRRMTCGRVGAGHCENHHFAPRECFGQINGFGAICAHAQQFGLGKFVAGGNTHGRILSINCVWGMCKYRAGLGTRPWVIRGVFRMARVIVIGAGQAGSSLVARLRNGGFDGDITLIGEEPAPPYQRPPLSKKYLLGEMDLERLYLRPESFYEENAIDLRLNRRVSAIDTGRNEVQLGEDRLAYDHLVLTTGSVPRRLPAAIGGDLDGVFTVRDLGDVDAMAPGFTAGKRVLIVGGGYIGLEAAAVAASKGLQVILVEMAARILQRVAAPETSDFFRDLHRAHGVDIREGVALETLRGEGHVTGARLGDGSELEVDFVIVGVGIQPATGLAEAAGLAIDNGIRVNELGQTSVANIWAAGDCASFPHAGGPLRLESVPNAIDMAECVAENIMGAGKTYVPQPWFWSDQYDVKLQIAGLNTGYDRIVTRPGSTAQSASFWYYAGDRLLAVDAMNEPRAYMVGKRLIDAGKTADPAIVADPDADLKLLMRA